MLCFIYGGKGVFYKMAMTEERKKYLYSYQKEKLKRVPLDMQKSDYDKLADAACAAGMSVNGYIKEAIAEKIGQEKPDV